jgi:XapX domain-containing protein
MKIVLGISLGLLIGAGCRWFDIPVPSPPKLVGAFASFSGETLGCGDLILIWISGHSEVLGHSENSFDVGINEDPPFAVASDFRVFAGSEAPTERVRVDTQEWAKVRRAGVYEIKVGATGCEAQKSSNRPERMQQRRAMMALAPLTDQRIPDCLRRSPITVRQPASTTPEPTKNFFSRYSA